MADIREPKRVAAPSEAPPSKLGFTRQLLNDGGEEKEVPPPGRNEESEKLRKSEEEGAAEVLLALVSSRPGKQRRKQKEVTLEGKEAQEVIMREIRAGKQTLLM